MIDQWHRATVRAVFDLTDKDNVIAFVVLAAIEAFEPSGGLFSEHRRAAWCLCQLNTSEALEGRTARESVGERHLMSSHDLNHVALALCHGGQ